MSPFLACRLITSRLILVDELVAYLRQFENGKQLTGGTFDSNLSFFQALTEALKAVPNAMMLASLPESEKEAGSKPRPKHE
jgi:predicted AAA+ superfamily ATPase